jgi:biopolymer transport protein ExbB
MNLLNLILLQADSLVPPAPVAAAAAPEKLSLFNLLMSGGILMIPLLICSIILVYVFVERWMAIRKASVHDPVFMDRIREQVLAGNLPGARSLCRGVQAPEARMIEKGITRIGKPIDIIEKSMENTGKQEIYKLEKNLGILSTIASIAPMFGFLGTIFGMIILFFDIQHNGFSIDSIAGGIYTKMVTSAVGLIIGLLSYMCYKYLNAMLNRTSARMEVASADFIDALYEPAATTR